MNEKRQQQIIADKHASDELRARGIEVSFDESRSPSQIIQDIGNLSLKETVKPTNEV